MKDCLDQAGLLSMFLGIVFTAFIDVGRPNLESGSFAPWFVGCVGGEGEPNTKHASFQSLAPTQDFPAMEDQLRSSTEIHSQQAPLSCFFLVRIFYCYNRNEAKITDMSQYEPLSCQRGASSLTFPSAIFRGVPQKLPR